MERNPRQYSGRRWGVLTNRQLAERFQHGIRLERLDDPGPHARHLPRCFTRGYEVENFRKRLESIVSIHERTDSGTLLLKQCGQTPARQDSTGRAFICSDQAATPGAGKT